MRKVVVLCLIIIIAGCSIQRKIIRPPAEKRKEQFSTIPPGVDSTIAINSLRKIERLFVKLERQKLADSLLTDGQELLEVTEELFKTLDEKRDILKKNREQYKSILKKRKKDQPLTLTDKKKIEVLRAEIVEDSTTISIVQSLFEYFLNYTEELFLRAIEVDKFNLNGFSYLAKCYHDRGIILEEKQAFEQAVRALLKFLKFDKGYYFIYHRLGINYYQQERWKKAYDNIFKAYKIFITTSYFSEQTPKLEGKYKKFKFPAPVDPLKYFRLIFDKALAEMRTYQADSALASLDKAYFLAPTKRDSTRIEVYKDWILWDNRNIRAAELRDEIADSLRKKNLEWARDAYEDSLLPIITTPKAKHEIMWRLSRVEHLLSLEKKKKEEELKIRERAANRLYKVVLEAGTKKKQNYYEAPPDSMYKIYFKDCGELFFQLGEEYRRMGFHIKARTYFVKDTTIDWTGRGKSFIDLAILSQFVHISPEKLKKLSSAERKRLLRNHKILAARLLHRALSFEEDLNEKELNLAYNQLINIYKQLNNRSKVKETYYRYQQWKLRHAATRGS